MENKLQHGMDQLVRKIINDRNRNKTYQIPKSIGSMIAKMINESGVMKRWSSFEKVRIELDTYQTFPYVRFIPPKMLPVTVRSMLSGKMNMVKYLRGTNEIHIKMSPRVLHNIRRSGDLIAFLKTAIEFYDRRVPTAGDLLIRHGMQLDRNIKNLIADTNLRGLFEFPIRLLMSFEDVQVENYRKVFSIKKSDIKILCTFIDGLGTKYKATDRSKFRLVGDVKELAKRMNESYVISHDELKQFSEALDIYANNGYQKEIAQYDHRFAEGCLDLDPPSNRVKYYREIFGGVKKLKKIPKDLIPYIQIETENIASANDKMMLATYTLGKIEIVEWYIALIDSESKKYIVPHSKEYLIVIRTQLLACYKKIMDVKIRGDRPLIDIQYPAGYEG